MLALIITDRLSTKSVHAYYLLPGLDTMTILTIRYKTVIVNHEELRHRNKGGNTNQYGLSHRDFELP